MALVAGYAFGSGFQNSPHEQDGTRRQVSDDEQEGPVHDQLDGLWLLNHCPSRADDDGRCCRRLGARLVRGYEGLVYYVGYQQADVALARQARPSMPEKSPA